MPTGNRRARATVAVLAASLALVTVIGPVAAAAPQHVSIVSDVTFAPQGEPNFGDFEASGDAAEEGLICESGTFVDTGIYFAGYQSGRGTVQLQVFKELYCGGGSIFVKMQIQANVDTGFETFTWVVQGGTGAYEHLRGSGRGHTVPRAGGNTNYYHGFLIG
jgi:hypothetical protein